MNTEKAIKLLREMQEAWKLQITGDAFDALEMAITALHELDKNLTKPNNSNQEVAKDTNVPSTELISRQAAIDTLKMDISIIPFAKAREYVRAAIETIYNRLEELPSVQPKQCDFEKKLRDMFDHIWYCEINHPIFKDTVGDLMMTVIDAHYRAQRSEIIRCRDCEYGEQDDDGWWYCRDTGYSMGDGEKGDGFCSEAERRTDEKT